MPTTEQGLHREGGTIRPDSALQGHERVRAYGNHTGFLCMNAKDLGIHEGELLRPNKSTGIMWNGICPHMGEGLKAKHRTVLRKRRVGALELWKLSTVVSQGVISARLRPSRTWRQRGQATCSPPSGKQGPCSWGVIFPSLPSQGSHLSSCWSCPT